MPDAFICDAVRTPIGRYGGALAAVRADDLAADPDPGADGAPSAASTGRAVDDVILGCANQAGEDNRNVARMAALLAGPAGRASPGATVNRLCGSGLEAVATAARAIRAGEADLVVAGGVESMTRAPFVMAKAETRLRARRADLRHDDRLALRQPADEGALRHRRDARDRRERRRGVRRSAARTRTPSPLRAARTARRPRRRAGCFAQRDRAGRPCRRARASRSSVDRGRASAPDTTLEALARLKPRRSATAAR